MDPLSRICLKTLKTLPQIKVFYFMSGNTWEVAFGGQILEIDGGFFFLVVTIIIDI